MENTVKIVSFFFFTYFVLDVNHTVLRKSLILVCSLLKGPIISIVFSYHTVPGQVKILSGLPLLIANYL